MQKLITNIRKIMIKIKNHRISNLIWVGFLEICFEDGGSGGRGGEGAGNITLLSKIVRILLETWKIFLLEPRISKFCWSYNFFEKNQRFCPKYYLYSKWLFESCVRDFLVLFSVFVGKKITINEKIKFTDYASRIRLPDCSKLAANWKKGNGITVFQHRQTCLTLFCFSCQI